MARVTFSEVGFESEGRAIVRDLSFTLPEGKLTLILGPSGSGKIVVPKLIGGILEPSKGVLSVDGVNVETPDREVQKKIRSKISYIFRNGGLISNLGIEENIRLSLDFHCAFLSETEKRERISRFLEFYKLAENILPKRPANLSRSEQKLVGIIRSMITEPKVVLIDEPLENCEPLAQRLVIKQILQNKSEGMTQTIIAQNLDQIIHLTDFILVLDHGRLVELESREEILNSTNPLTQKVISDYYLVK